MGGGSGGVVAATNLGRKLGAQHDVILVDKRADHLFMPAFLFVMVGERQTREISRSLSLLEKRNVKFIQSEVLGIDPDRQQVELQNQKLDYDYLIVSLGMQVRPDLVPGFAEASVHPWELDGALRLRESLNPSTRAESSSACRWDRTAARRRRTRPNGCSTVTLGNAAIATAFRSNTSRAIQNRPASTETPSFGWTTKAGGGTLSNTTSLWFDPSILKKKKSPGFTLQDPVRFIGHGAAAPAGASAFRLRFGGN